MGTDGDQGESTRGMDMHMVVHGRVERGNKKGWMVVKVLELRDETEEVLTYKIMLGDPDLSTTFVEDVELVGVLVFNMGTGGGLKEVGKEQSIDQIHGQGWGNCKYDRG